MNDLLAAECREQQAELYRAQAARSVSRLVQKLARQFGSLRLKESGWAALAPGIKRSYRDGRRGYQAARDAGRRPEELHAWRKRVKDLYYQVGLLRPIWPEQMAAIEAKLEHLAECLGEDHDLFLLTEPNAFKQLRKRARKEAECLKSLVDKRHQELESFRSQL